MTPEQREMPLPSRYVEYLVHGLWRRSSDAPNTIPGAWWVPLEQLIQMVGKQGLEDLKGAIEVFDTEISADREALYADAFPSESEGEEEAVVGGQLE